MSRIGNKEYLLGEYGKKYGIWNSKSQQFQFGIVEDTPMLAEAQLFNKIGNDARQWRFKVRRISDGEIKKMEEKKTSSLKRQIKYLENIVGYAISMIPKEQYPHGVHEGTILPWIKNRVKEEMSALGDAVND
jgi:hypothetical protein